MGYRKWHMTPNGPKPCRARFGSCPYADNEHFYSRIEKTHFIGETKEQTRKQLKEDLEWHRYNEQIKKRNRGRELLQLLQSPENTINFHVGQDGGLRDLKKQMIERYNNTGILPQNVLLEYTASLENWDERFDIDKYSSGSFGNLDISLKREIFMSDTGDVAPRWILEIGKGKRIITVNLNGETNFEQLDLFIGKINSLGRNAEGKKDEIRTHLKTIILGVENLVQMKDNHAYTVGFQTLQDNIGRIRNVNFERPNIGSYTYKNCVMDVSVAKKMYKSKEFDKRIHPIWQINISEATAAGDRWEYSREDGEGSVLFTTILDPSDKKKIPVINNEKTLHQHFLHMGMNNDEAQERVSYLSNLTHDFLEYENTIRETVNTTQQEDPRKYLPNYGWGDNPYHKQETEEKTSFGEKVKNFLGF